MNTSMPQAGSSSSKAGSRRPFALIAVVGLAIVALQVSGLLSLVAAAGQRHQWDESRSGRQDISRRWEELNADLQRQISEQQKKLTSINADVQRAKLDRENAVAALAASETELNAAKERLIEAVNGHQQASASRASAETAIADLASQRTKLQEQIDLLRAEHDRLPDQARELNVTVKRLTLQLEEAKTQLANVEAEVKSQQEKANTLRSELNGLTAEKAILIKEHAELLAAVNAAKQLLEKTAIEQTDLEQNRELQTTAVTELEQRIAGLEEQRVNAEKQVEASTAQVAETDKLLAAKQKELSIVLGRVDAARRDEQQLAEAISRLSAAARSSASPATTQPSTHPATKSST